MAFKYHSFIYEISLVFRISVSSSLSFQVASFTTNFMFISFKAQRNGPADEHVFNSGWLDTDSLRCVLGSEDCTRENRIRDKLI